MRPGRVARDLTDREIKSASYQARQQGRFALRNGQDELAAFWTAVLGELQAERTRRFSEGMRADNDPPDRLRSRLRDRWGTGTARE